jgi:hypothetical protein
MATLSTEIYTVSSSTPLQIYASPQQTLTLRHVQGGTLYYKNSSSVSSTSNDGSLTSAGSSVVLTSAAWVISATSTKIVTIPRGNPSIDDGTVSAVDLVSGVPTFDVTSYGARGDGVTDDIAAIELAAAAARAAGGVVYFPASTTAYMISTAMPGDVSYLGATRSVTIRALAALASATNKMMLDIGINAPVGNRTVQHLTFDAQSLAAVQHIGSRNGKNGNYGFTYRDLTFQNAADDAWSCGPGPGVDSGSVGMFCGAVFERINWEGCAHAIKLGVSSDDVTFTSPRFQMKQSASSNTTGPLIYVGCTKATFIEPYVSMGDTGWQPAGNFSCIFYVDGSGPVHIKNIALEGVGGSTDITHVIRSVNASPVVVDGGVIGVKSASTTAASYLSFVKYDIPSTVLHNHLAIRGTVPGTSDTAVPLLKVNVSNGAVTAGCKLNFEFAGVDGFTTLMDATLTGDSGLGIPVTLNGTYKGTRYRHGTDQALWAFGMVRDLPEPPQYVEPVASTAALTLPVTGRVFEITGTAAITSISTGGGTYERQVTLMFSGNAATTGLTDGSNLKLAGNLVYTPDDTITLVCIGSNWHEVARSVN